MSLIWTEPMLAALQRLRAQGLPIALCAEKIGVGFGSAVYQCRRMGLAGRLNSGRMTGQQVIEKQEGVLWF